MDIGLIIALIAALLVAISFVLPIDGVKHKHGDRIYLEGYESRKGWVIHVDGDMVAVRWDSDEFGWKKKVI